MHVQPGAVAALLLSAAAASLDAGAPATPIERAQARLEDGDAEGAAKLAREALAAARSGGGEDGDAAAAALEVLADAERNLGKLGDAERDLASARAIRVRRSGPESLEAARADLLLCSLRSDQARRAEAKTACDHALAVREQALGPQSIGVAEVLGMLAQLAQDGGDQPGARDLYERALAIREKVDGPDTLATLECENNLGTLLSDMGEYAEGRRVLARVVASLERTRGPADPLLAFPLNNLGVIATEQGDYPGARAFYGRAIAIEEKAMSPDDASLFGDLVNYGYLLRVSGRYDEAEALFRKALAQREKTVGPDHPDTAKVLGHLGQLARARGRLDEAEAYLRRALAIYEKANGPRHPSVAFIAAQLAAVRLDRGDAKGALPLAERALAIDAATFPAHHQRIVRALAVRADAEALLGRTAAALRDRAAALDAVEPQLARNVEGLAELAQIRYFAENREYLDDWLAAAPSPASDRAAYQHLLRWKGAAELLASARQLETWASASPEVKAKLARLAAVRAAGSRLAARAPSSEQGRAAQRGELEKLDAEATALESELSEKSEGFRARARFLDGTLDDVCAALPKNAALVDYLLITPRRGEPRYLAFGLRHAGRGCAVARVALAAPAKEVAARIAAWQQAVRAGAGALAARRGAAVREAIVDPVAALWRGAAVAYVVPDAAISAVPFGALPGADGRYLLESTSFSWLDSAKDLLRSAPGGSRRPALVVAASQPAGKAGEIAGAAFAQRSACLGALPPLPGAQAEGEAVAKLLGPSTRLLEAAQATEGGFRGAVSHSGVVHVAAHGYVLGARCAGGAAAGVRGEEAGAAATNPLYLSGLVFAPGNSADSTDDGVLSAAELAALDLRGVRLMVLSACDSGGGEAVDGQGVLGLRRAVLAGGVPSLVVSLWKVPDAETRELMEGFYARLPSAGAREALRSAQIALLARLRAADRADAVQLFGAFIHAGR